MTAPPIPNCGIGLAKIQAWRSLADLPGSKRSAQSAQFQNPSGLNSEQNQLADIVSKNGNLLLNIGPRADGAIPDEVQQTLLQVGSWLKKNGEAIYGTRPWHTFGEGPTDTVAGPFQDTKTHTYTPQDFRFTEKNGVLFAIELGWPPNNEAVVHSLAPSKAGLMGQITSVRLLGLTDDLRFEWQSDGLHLQLPPQPVGRYAYVFRIKLTGSQ
jgi:alpha-L-fucosidase